MGPFGVIYAGLWLHTNAISFACDRFAVGHAAWRLPWVYNPRLPSAIPSGSVAVPGYLRDPCWISCGTSATFGDPCLISCGTLATFGCPFMIEPRMTAQRSQTLAGGLQRTPGIESRRHADPGGCRRSLLFRAIRPVGVMCACLSQRATALSFVCDRFAVGHAAWRLPWVYNPRLPSVIPPGSAVVPPLRSVIPA